MRSAAVLGAAFACASVLLAQESAVDRPSRFEVASVKPSTGPLTGLGPPVNGTVRTPGIDVRRLVQYAFNLDRRRHDPIPAGGPSWIDTDLYEVIARGPADMTFAEARRAMLTLLEERFKLRVRVEKRELPVYALTVARTDGMFGPGLRKSKTDCRAYSDTLLLTGRGVLARARGPDCGLLGGGAGSGRLQIRGTATIREMLRLMARSPDVDRPLVDRTGLTDTFDIELTWAPLRTGLAAAAPLDVLSLFSAVGEQLGLRLDSRREPLDVVLIEAIERPTPN